MKNACVVLPTFNESESLPLLIPLIFDQSGMLPEHDIDVLVVDDLSPDGTSDVVKKLQKKYPDLHLLSGTKKGLGDAYRRGFIHALKTLNPDFVFQMDADLQHDPAMIPVFLTSVASGHTLVIGSRFVEEGVTPGYSFIRKCQSKLGSLLIRTFMGIKGVRDCTSGYRCIDAGLLACCDLSSLPSDGFTFQSQLLYELIRNGAKVKEVPIIFKRRKHGRSKLTMADRFDFIFNLIFFRFRWTK